MSEWIIPLLCGIGIGFCVGYFIGYRNGWSIGAFLSDSFKRNPK